MDEIFVVATKSAMAISLTLSATIFLQLIKIWYDRHNLNDNRIKKIVEKINFNPINSMTFKILRLITQQNYNWIGFIVLTHQ